MSSRIAAGLPPLKRTPGKTGAPGVGTKNLQKASHTEKSKNFENGIEREGQLGGGRSSEPRQRRDHGGRDVRACQPVKEPSTSRPAPPRRCRETVPRSLIRML